jgi:hypothetical protein
MPLVSLPKRTQLLALAICVLLLIAITQIRLLPPFFTASLLLSSTVGVALALAFVVVAVHLLWQPQPLINALQPYTATPFSGAVTALAIYALSAVIGQWVPSSIFGHGGQILGIIGLLLAAAVLWQSPTTDTQSPTTTAPAPIKHAAWYLLAVWVITTVLVFLFLPPMLTPDSISRYSVNSINPTASPGYGLIVELGRLLTGNALGVVVLQHMIRALALLVVYHALKPLHGKVAFVATLLLLIEPFNLLQLQYILTESIAINLLMLNAALLFASFTRKHWAYLAGAGIIAAYLLFTRTNLVAAIAASTLVIAVWGIPRWRQLAILLGTFALSFAALLGVRFTTTGSISITGYSTGIEYVTLYMIIGTDQFHPDNGPYSALIGQTLTECGVQPPRPYLGGFSQLFNSVYGCREDLPPDINRAWAEAVIAQPRQTLALVYASLQEQITSPTEQRIKPAIRLTSLFMQFEEAPNRPPNCVQRYQLLAPTYPQNIDATSRFSCVYEPLFFVDGALINDTIINFTTLVQPFQWLGYAWWARWWGALLLVGMILQRAPSFRPLVLFAVLAIGGNAFYYAVILPLTEMRYALIMLPMFTICTVLFVFHLGKPAQLPWPPRRALLAVPILLAAAFASMLLLALYVGRTYPIQWQSQGINRSFSVDYTVTWLATTPTTDHRHGVFVGLRWESFASPQMLQLVDASTRTVFHSTSIETLNTSEDVFYLPLSDFAPPVILVVATNFPSTETIALARIATADAWPAADILPPTNASIGALNITGQDLSADGDGVRLRLNLTATERIREDGVMFVHLYDQSGNLIAQNDSIFLRDQYTASALIPNRALTVTRTLAAPAGTYRLVVGLYDAITGARWPVRLADGTVSPDRVLDMGVVTVP